MNTPADLSPHTSQSPKLWLKEARSLLWLAMTELAFMAMVTADVIMMGRLGATSQAAGALSAQYFWVFEFLTFGVLSAVAPIVSQHLGARRFRAIHPTLRQGLWVAILLALLCGILTWHAGSILVYLGQDPLLAEMGQSYLNFMLIGLLPSLWHGVMGDFMAAHERRRTVRVVSITGIIVNALANYVFMFGHFGMLAMGLAGAGVATAIITIFTVLAVLVFVLTDRRLRRYYLLGYFWRVDWKQLNRIVAVGLPIALMDTAKLGALLAGYLLMGLLGIDALAAHGVTIQCIEVLLIIPIGLMQAASVRVGHAASASDPIGTLRAGMIAIWMGFFYTLLIAVVGVYFDSTEAENGPAITLAVAFLSVGVLFFVSDSVQTITQGALMGLTDTKIPMVLSLSFNAFSLPAAAYFGIYLGYGGQAIWWSLSLPLAVLAVLFILRFRLRSRNLDHLIEETRSLI